VKLVAKDFTNKTGLLDAVIDICGKFIDVPKITIIGIPDVRCPTSVKQLKFKLLPRNTVLDIPEIPSLIVEQAFCWTHTEARISNEEDDLGMPWISENTLTEIIGTWNSLEKFLSENSMDLEDYCFKVTSEKKSSYTLTREDLMFLLSLKGSSTLRQVLLDREQHPLELMEMITNSISHRMLDKSVYSTEINYPVSIKAMGDRINLLIKNLESYSPNLRNSLTSQLVHDLKLLQSKYPETDCIGVSGNTVDVCETANSLMMIKDTEYMHNVGSAVLKPLNIIFASIASGAVWSIGLQVVNDIITKTDREILAKYGNNPHNKKPFFAGVL
jgi:hypothetical protein